MRRAPGRTGGWVGACLLGIVVFMGAAWGASAYIQPGDWQYQALDSLSQAGLLAGHPKAPLSAWTDRLSRYEAASLTLRAVEGIGEAYQAQGAKLRELAQMNEAPEAGEAATEPSASATEGPALRTEDLLTAQKLLEEFRTELVGMGERLDELNASLKLVLGMVEEVQKQVAALAADQKKHAINGYAQFRFGNDDATDGHQNFNVRRTRVNFRGPVSPKISYRVEVQLDASVSGQAPGSKAQLRTLAFDYKFTDQTFLRAGQVILPFGYELETPVPNLWSGERSYVMDALFPNQRDNGFFVERRTIPTAGLFCSPSLDLGVFNGTGLNAYDNNDDINGLARANFLIPHGSLALSAYLGTNGAEPAQTDQNRYGVSAQLGLGETQFMGEYIAGQNLGANVFGWYAQVGHPLLKSRSDLVFAKYDMYDEDDAVPDDNFRRWTLGYYYDLTPASRLTFVYELRDVEPGFSQYEKYDGDAQYLQWQVKY
jgi:hypothetical protein